MKATKGNREPHATFETRPTMKRVIERCLARLGYQIIRRRPLQNLYMANHLANVLRLYGVDCVLDVGANRGQFARNLRDDLHFDGPLHSFEPVSKNFVHLEAEAKNDPNWSVYRVALGDRDGEASINVMRSDDMSSFFEPDNTFATQFAETNVVEATERVPVRRLDEIELGNCGRMFLKIDTQGFDTAVFRGATNMLDRIVVLQSEVSFLPTYKNAPTWREALDLYYSNGFSISLITPISHDEQERLITADALFIKAAEDRRIDA